MKQITAKFNSKCAETGKAIKKGESMLYNYTTKKCYSMDSDTAKKNQRDAESRSVNDYIDAQESAMFERY